MKQQQKYNNNRERQIGTNLQFSKFSHYFIANFIGSAKWPKAMCLPDFVHLPTRISRKQMTIMVF